MLKRISGVLKGRHVDVRFTPGQFHVLTGVNGCGKTALLNAVEFAISRSVHDVHNKKAKAAKVINAIGVKDATVEIDAPARLLLHEVMEAWTSPSKMMDLWAEFLSEEETTHLWRDLEEATKSYKDAKKAVAVLLDLKSMVEDGVVTIDFEMEKGATLDVAKEAARQAKTAVTRINREISSVLLAAAPSLSKDLQELIGKNNVYVTPMASPPVEVQVDGAAIIPSGAETVLLQFALASLLASMWDSDDVCAFLVTPDRGISPEFLDVFQRVFSSASEVANLQAIVTTTGDVPTREGRHVLNLLGKSDLLSDALTKDSMYYPGLPTEYEL